MTLLSRKIRFTLKKNREKKGNKNMNKLVITVLMFAIPLFYFLAAVIMQSKKIAKAYKDEDAELLYSVRELSKFTWKHCLMVVLAVVLYILLNGCRFVAFGCNIKSVVAIAMLYGALMLEFAVRLIKKQKS